MTLLLASILFATPLVVLLLLHPEFPMFVTRLERLFRLLRTNGPRDPHWYLDHESLVNMTAARLSAVSGIPWSRKACSASVFRHVVLNEAKALRTRLAARTPDSERASA